MSILEEYFEDNKAGLQAYNAARLRYPIVITKYLRWTDISENDHVYLANTEAWMDARVLLHDSAQTIQKAWKAHQSRNYDVKRITKLRLH
jgi:hypothetical protein